jgi:protein-disulfide isomerase
MSLFRFAPAVRGFSISVFCAVLGLTALAAGCQKSGDAAGQGAGLETPFVGAETPKVDILAFVDFECPFCRAQAKPLLDVVAKHNKDVRIRFFNFPLDVNQQSVVGAKAAVAAHKQKAYRKYFDKFMGGAAITREAAVAWAVEAGIDAKKFTADMDSPDTAKIVGRDVSLAKAMGMTGTPSFMINGNLMQGVQSPKVWENRIAEEIARAEALLATGTKMDDLQKALVSSGNPKGAADYIKYVLKGQPAPAAEVPAKVVRTSGVASANVTAVGGTGGMQVGDPVQVGGEQGDPSTVWQVAIRPDDPSVGPATAPVTVVVFEDMQCPFCARLKPTLSKLSDDYKGKIRVVFKHNPLPFHKDAENAAKALEAARQQGKFWEMRELLLTRQDKLDLDSLKAYATELKLNRSPFDTALAASGAKERIDADAEQAAALGARGTPNLFINGRKLVGAKEEKVLRELIDVEMKKAEDLIKAGTAADKVYEAIVGKGKLLDSLGLEPKEIDVTGAATRGPAAAAIHIVTFQDFQCPFSARLDPHIADIEKEFPGRVKVTWMDFPLSDIHPMAQAVAEAGQEAQKQGKFWQFHKEIMADNSRLDQDAVLERAKKAGMDVKALKEALDRHTHADAVAKQRKIGETIGVKGTPSVFINGHAFVPQTGFSANTFRSAVRRLLGTR